MSIVNEKIKALKDKECKLLLIIGKPGSGKSKLIHEYSSECGINILEIDQILGDKIPYGKDITYITDFLKGFLKTYAHEAVLLDKKRILYSDEKIDLLDFLYDLAKEKIVVATWNGYINDDKLIHICSKNDNNLEYDFKALKCDYIIV